MQCLPAILPWTIIPPANLLIHHQVKVLSNFYIIHILYSPIHITLVSLETVNCCRCEWLLVSSYQPCDWVSACLTESWDWLQLPVRDKQRTIGWMNIFFSPELNVLPHIPKSKLIFWSSYSRYAEETCLHLFCISDSEMGEESRKRFYQLLICVSKLCHVHHTCVWDTLQSHGQMVETMTTGTTVPFGNIKVYEKAHCQVLYVQISTINLQDHYSTFDDHSEYINPAIANQILPNLLEELDSSKKTQQANHYIPRIKLEAQQLQTLLLEIKDSCRHVLFAIQSS